MGMNKGTGWLARQESAKAALAAREGGAHPVADNLANQERQRMIAERAAADLAHAEAVEQQRSAMMIECPCCHGEGLALLNDAAKMVEAIRRYDFAGWRPDADTLARLLPLAVAVDGNGNRITADETAEAQTVEEAVSEAHAVEAKKPTRRHVVPPHLAD